MSDDKSGYAYHIIAWDSIWDGKIMKNDTKNIVLNPNGENVKAVYYYETNGSGEILLYGEQQNPCGEVIKQPNSRASGRLCNTNVISLCGHVDSYSSSQYFWEILLFMLPIYCVLLLLIYFIK